MLLTHLESFLKLFDKAKAIYVGYSGGLDSTVLLHALSQTAYKSQLKAVHIHHGLSPQADQWSSHCQDFCVQLQIPLHIEKINIPQLAGQSLEAEARKLRYAVLKKFLQRNDCICIAHHQDDQAETFLLQLFRGAGVKGLSSMPAIKNFGDGYLIRPLLNLPRADLLQYAKEQQLSWIDDESNMNNRFHRNFIRHEMMPIIKNRWPAAEKILARTAIHFAETQELLDKVASEHYEQCVGSHIGTLSIAKLLTLDQAARRNLIRFWIHKQNFSPPTQKKLLQIENEILLARRDANPLVYWSSVAVRRYRDNLYVMSLHHPHDPAVVVEWDGKEDLILPHDLGIIAKAAVFKNIECKINQHLTIRFRQGGEVLYLPHRGHCAVKKLMQEWGIPVWLRDRIPLIFLDDKLVWVYTPILDKQM